MKKKTLLILLCTGLLLISWKNSSTQTNEAITTPLDALQNNPTIVYKTDHLIVEKLTSHIYKHTSFLNTTDFGRVECNGMIAMNESEAVVFDTPASNESTKELIFFLTEKLKYKVKAIIPTHFHEDCVAGLEVFNEYNIPCYASNKTITILKDNNRKFTKPINGFDDRLGLTVGDKMVYAEYFGEGHTKDNIIGSFPDDNAIFGGCLIKALGATKGNLEDANVSAWSATVRKLKQKYPNTAMVIPGHGKQGNAELFDYTITLFE